jgi:hypothetical protein
LKSQRLLGLEPGPLSTVRINEELLVTNSSGSGLENRDKQPWGPVALTTKHRLPVKVGINFAGLGSQLEGIFRLQTGGFYYLY